VSRAWHVYILAPFANDLHNIILVCFVCDLPRTRLSRTPENSVKAKVAQNFPSRQVGE